MPSKPPQPMACILILLKILAMSATEVVKKTPVMNEANTAGSSGWNLKNTLAIQK